MDDDDTQVYKDDGNALLIAYQSGYYDGKKAAQAKVEGPLHVVCQCDKCKPQISFNAEIIGYVEPQRPWVGLTAEEAAECWTTSATQTWKNFEAKLKEKNNG